MKKYLVQVTETLQHTYVVEAENQLEAIEIIDSACAENKIIIDSCDDFIEREVNISPSALKDGTVSEAMSTYYDKYEEV